MHALQHVLKAVSANNPIPILTGIHIEATGRELVLTGSHTTMSIEARIMQDGSILSVLETGSIVVPARYFYEIVRKLDDGIVILDGTESIIAAISSENTSIRLCGMDAQSYPKRYRSTRHCSTVYRFCVDGGILKSAIKQAASAVSTSETRPVLTGVCLTYHGSNELQLTSTDGIRLATCTIPIENLGGCIEPANFIVSGRHLLDVASMIGEQNILVELEASNHQIVVQTPDFRIQLSPIEGSYPSTDSIIPRSYRSEMIVETPRLLHALERAAVLAEDRIVRLSANKECLGIVSRTAAIGDMKEFIPVAMMQGEPFVLSFNGKMLVDIVRCLECTGLRLWFTGDRGPIVLQPVDRDDISSMLFLLTPIRTAVHAQAH
ncbi:DNA polymerase III subunit beta [Paenibacillus sp. PR3]|uniref:Beta sliding clamp n=2 Tax=Paenibacillus terricola TaxID=2763503 RepID=A0ABR8MX28_9BACL|nr:DNA polymerase III subunit beta [Paenibacillus terricola]